MAILSTAVAAPLLLKPLVSDLYDHLKKKIGKRLKLHDIDLAIGNMYKRLEEIKMVKTLACVTDSCDLTEFYCPQRIIFKTKTTNQNIEVRSADDLGERRHLVITGTAGQGKSIFLRHLCIGEMISANTIPIFVELRRLQKGQSILNLIGRSLEMFRIPIDDEILREFMDFGRFSFFFDGYDEIRASEKERAFIELEYIAAIAGNNRILITTRPENKIELSNKFQVADLDILRGYEYQAIIDKLSSDSSLKTDLIAAIESHPGHISQLLQTPLLVSFLVITYSSYHDLPGQLTEFYERLFEVLLFRHDATKAEWARCRKSELNDRKFREAFDAFCYYSKASGRNSISNRVIYTYTEKAFDFINHNGNPEDFVDDIVNITCLVLRDGADFAFVHDSVQEFFTASFLRELPTDVRKKFYQQCFNLEIRQRWSQELRFLAEIDKYEYFLQYLIPRDVAYLGLKSDWFNRKKINVTKTLIKRVLRGVSVQVSSDGEFIRLGLTEFPERQLVFRMAMFVEKMKDEIFSLVSNGAIRHTNMRPKMGLAVKTWNAPNKDGFEISLTSLMTDDKMADAIVKACSRPIRSIHDRLRNAQSYVNSQNRTDILSDLDALIRQTS